MHMSKLFLGPSLCVLGGREGGGEGQIFVLIQNSLVKTVLCKKPDGHCVHALAKGRPLCPVWLLWGRERTVCAFGFVWNSRVKTDELYLAGLHFAWRLWPGSQE